MPIRGAGGVA
jgi:protein-L-isoaspartate(D-aspartate) O-methyltransferase